MGWGNGQLTTRTTVPPILSQPLGLIPNWPFGQRCEFPQRPHTDTYIRTSCGRASGPCDFTLQLPRILVTIPVLDGNQQLQCVRGSRLPLAVCMEVSSPDLLFSIASSTQTAFTTPFIINKVWLLMPMIINVPVISIYCCLKRCL